MPKYRDGLPRDLPRVIGPIVHHQSASRGRKTDEGWDVWHYQFQIDVGDKKYFAYTKKYANQFAYLMGSRQRWI